MIKTLDEHRADVAAILGARDDQVIEMVTKLARIRAEVAPKAASNATVRASVILAILDGDA